MHARGRAVTPPAPVRGWTARGGTARPGRMLGVVLAVSLLTTVLTPPADSKVELMRDVIITLRQQAGHSLRGAEGHEQVIAALQHHAEATQAPVMDVLSRMTDDGLVDRTEPLWITNAISVTATPSAIRRLRALPSVASVRPEDSFVAPAVPTATAAASGAVEAIGAPTVWSSGVKGAGTVVAVLDTGVDLSHPDIAEAWRGAGADWFDPYGEHESPYDPTGHGTWVTGVVLGHDEQGPAVGVAPDAQWIAARVFDDRGIGTTTGIHQALQWVADPDGDPATDDTPDVLNNSWVFETPGCNTEFQPDFTALGALGVTSVASAGNSGPSASSSHSPANYPEVLSVGALQTSDEIWSGSSRGPSSCGGRDRVFPDVVAPGSDVETTDLFGGWTTVSGTSIAAPHLAGALALLMSGRPCMTDAALTDVITTTAADLGDTGADDVFGHGRLDVAAAWQYLEQQGTRPDVADVAVAPSADSPVSLDVTASASSPTGIWGASVLEPGARSRLAGQPMVPTSAAWGDCRVPLATSVDVTGWPVGQHGLAVTADARDGSRGTSARSLVVLGPADLVFGDGFETGDLSRWTRPVGTPRLAVVDSAVPTGVHALRARVRPGRLASVVDTSPAAATRYRAGFWFRSAVRGSDDVGYTAFSGVDTEAAPLFTVQVRHSDAVGTELRLGVAAPNGMRWSSWSALSSGGHHVEVSWESGSQGEAALVVDGGVVARVLARGTDGQLDSICLGVCSRPGAGPSGAIVVDGFASTEGSPLIMQTGGLVSG